MSIKLLNDINYIYENQSIYVRISLDLRKYDIILFTKENDEYN